MYGYYKRITKAKARQMEGFKPTGSDCDFFKAGGEDCG